MLVINVEVFFQKIGRVFQINLWQNIVTLIELHTHIYIYIYITFKLTNIKLTLNYMQITCTYIEITSVKVVMQE